MSKRLKGNPIASERGSKNVFEQFFKDYFKRNFEEYREERFDYVLDCSE